MFLRVFCSVIDSASPSSPLAVFITVLPTKSNAFPAYTPVAFITARAIPAATNAGLYKLSPSEVFSFL